MAKYKYDEYNSAFICSLIAVDKFTDNIVISYVLLVQFFDHYNYVITAHFLIRLDQKIVYTIYSFRGNKMFEKKRKILILDKDITAAKKLAVILRENEKIEYCLTANDPHIAFSIIAMNPINTLIVNFYLGENTIRGDIFIEKMRQQYIIDTAVLYNSASISIIENKFIDKQADNYNELLSYLGI
jgi:hypothetical protein